MPASTGPNFGLKYGWNLGETGWNSDNDNNLVKIDNIAQLSVKDRDLATPPVSPTHGDRYIVAAGASGAWAGKDGQIAVYWNSAWIFYVPKDGWMVLVSDESILLRWNQSATAWQGFSTGGSQPLDGDLTAIAALTGTGIPERTGADTWALTPVTAAGKALLDDADAAAQRTTLGCQAADADLDAVAGLSTTGLIARTGAGTASTRTLTAPAAGITVSNGDGVAGNPTLALANDLGALEGLSTTGLARRTAADTWETIEVGPDPQEIPRTDDLGSAAFASIEQLLNMYVYPVTAAATLPISGTLGQLVLCTGTAPYTVTLPKASDCPAGWYAFIKNATGGALTLSTQGSDTLEGAASLGFAAGDGLLLTLNGTSFYTVNRALNYGTGPDQIPLGWMLGSAAWQNQTWLDASATYDPPSLAQGTNATTTITALGAEMGDFAQASFSLDLQGVILTAYVSAADTVTVNFQQNHSGTAIDLASGTVYVRVNKRIA